MHSLQQKSSCDSNVTTVPEDTLAKRLMKASNVLNNEVKPGLESCYTLQTDIDEDDDSEFQVLIHSL